MSIQKRQNGVILIFLVIIIAVLLGIAAFSLDLGRLLVLKTEMQNAVDEAALAGAKELDAQPGAVARAKAAALGLIQEQSHFAKLKEVLSPDLVEGTDVTFHYYCAIENDLDENGQPPSSECGDYQLVNEVELNSDVNGNGHLDRKVEIPASAADADIYVHYIEITLNPNQTTTETPRYTIPLFFLPALRAIGINAPTEAPTSVRALAGRQYRPCKYPPIMMCDPSEDPTLPPLDVGDMVVLKALTGPNSTWAPGNFGFLMPAACLDEKGEDKCTGNEVRTEIENQLANEGDMGCQPPYVSTYPGANSDPKFAIQPINTRFGIGSSLTNPAAPNVIDYPRDDNLYGGRFGDGALVQPPYSPLDPPPTTVDQLKQMSEEQYTHYYFSSPVPSLEGAPIRYNHYLKEIQSSILPNNTTSGIQDCKDIGGNTNKLKDCRNIRGTPGTYVGDANRRVIYVASMQCVAQGIKGNMNHIFVPPPPAGWKKFFLTEHVIPASDDPEDKISYFAEYLGPASESDGNFDVVIQLYE